MLCSLIICYMSYCTSTVEMSYSGFIPYNGSTLPVQFHILRKKDVDDSASSKQLFSRPGGRARHRQTVLDSFTHEAGRHASLLSSCFVSATRCLKLWLGFMCRQPWKRLCQPQSFSLIPIALCPWPWSWSCLALCKTSVRKGFCQLNPARDYTLDCFSDSRTALRELLNDDWMLP